MAFSFFFIDGFDFYNDLHLRWDVVHGPNSIDLTGTKSRSGLGCLEINTGAFGPTKSFAIGAQTNILGSGAVNPGGAVPSSGVFELMHFTDSTSGADQVRIVYNGDLSISAYNHNAPTPLGTSAAGVINPNGYNFIAARCFIDQTNGSVLVWVNGVLVLNLTGVQTKRAGTQPVDQFTPLIAGGIVTGFWDDIALATWTDPAADLFTQTPSWLPAAPVSDSAPLQWTPNAGLTHWTQVSTIPEDTSKWVQDATVGQIDQYIHAIPANQLTTLPLPATPAVLAVSHSLLAETDVAGPRSIGSSKSGAGAPTSFAISTSAHYYDQCYTPGLAAYGDLATTPFGPEVTA